MKNNRRHLSFYLKLTILLMLLNGFTFSIVSRLNAQNTPTTENANQVKKPSPAYPIKKFKEFKTEQKNDSIDLSSADKVYQKIKRHYRSSDFDYNEAYYEQSNWLQRIIRRIRNLISNLFPEFQTGMSKTIYYIFVLFGFVLLIYILYKLFASGRSMSYKEEKEIEENSQTWIRKNITEVNMDAYLDKALSSKNYSEAIRYLHLINLKKLIAHDKISWDYQKTNQEFLRELKDEKLKQDFKETSKIFEYVWYGDFKITEGQFSDYQKLFNRFNQNIS